MSDEVQDVETDDVEVAGDSFSEEFEGAEETEEVQVAEEAAVKKAAKPVAMLTEEKCIPNTYEAYLMHVRTIVPLQLEMDPSKKYTVEEVWDVMNNSDRTGANKAFKKKGKFGGGGGGGKEAVAKSAAHQEAIDIQKAIRDGANAFIQDNHMDDFNKLQALVGVEEKDGKDVPVAPISIEIYFKGWTKFVAALPEDE